MRRSAKCLLFFASWQHVNDRPIQEGDFVLLDVDVIEEIPAVPLFVKTRFEVTEKSMAKWMYELVVGRNKGDSSKELAFLIKTHPMKTKKP